MTATLKELNERVQANWTNRALHYTMYIHQQNVDLNQYTEETLEESKRYYDADGKRVIGMRLSEDKTQVTFIDFYVEGVKRPYQRVFLNEDQYVTVRRYYEGGTWQPHTDIYHDARGNMVYSIEYLDNKKYRWVDWSVKPGTVFDQKMVFLQHMKAWQIQ